MEGLASVTPMDDRTMRLERTFRASPAQVFAAWTDPKALPRWFGPDGFACRTHRIDLRVGGEWVFDMVGHGTTFPNRHRWTEITPHSRIAFLMDAGEGLGEPMSVEVTLSPDGAGTQLVQIVTFRTAEAHNAAKGYHAEARGQETLRKLAASLGE